MPETLQPYVVAACVFGFFGVHPSKRNMVRSGDCSQPIIEPGLELRSGPRTTHSCITQSATNLCYDAEVVVHVPHLADDLTITIQVLQSHNSSNTEMGGSVSLTTTLSTLCSGTNGARKKRMPSVDRVGTNRQGGSCCVMRRILATACDSPRASTTVCM